MTVAPVVFWTQIFAKYFINSIDEYQDDMLFYVKIKNKIIVSLSKIYYKHLKLMLSYFMLENMLKIP